VVRYELLPAGNQGMGSVGWLSAAMELWPQKRWRWISNSHKESPSPSNLLQAQLVLTTESVPRPLSSDSDTTCVVHIRVLNAHTLPVPAGAIDVMGALNPYATLTYLDQRPQVRLSRLPDQQSQRAMNSLCCTCVSRRRLLPGVLATRNGTSERRSSIVSPWAPELSTRLRSVAQCGTAAWSPQTGE
jgi:hypothetical protein